MRGRVGLAFLILLPLLPTAQAQAPSTGPEAQLVVPPTDAALPNGRLVPATGVAHLPIDLSIACPAKPSIVPMQVTFRLEATASYAFVAFNPASSVVNFPAQACSEPPRARRLGSARLHDA